MLGALLILALAGASGAAAQAPVSDDEIVRLIFEDFKEPPLSDAQRAAVKKFVHDAEPAHKLLLPEKGETPRAEGQPAQRPSGGVAPGGRRPRPARRLRISALILLRDREHREGPSA